MPLIQPPTFRTYKVEGGGNFVATSVTIIANSVKLFGHDFDVVPKKGKSVHVSWQFTVVLTFVLLITVVAVCVIGYMSFRLDDIVTEFQSVLFYTMTWAFRLGFLAILGILAWLQRK